MLCYNTLAFSLVIRKDLQWALTLVFSQDIIAYRTKGKVDSGPSAAAEDEDDEDEEEDDDDDDDDDE